MVGVHLPVPAQSPEAGGAVAAEAEVTEAEITKEIAAQYFSGIYAKNRQAWVRMQRAIEWIRMAVVLFGVGICAAAVYVTWREIGANDLNALYAALGQRAFMLFTGALVALIGAVPLLWRYRWQLPVGVFALGMAIEMTVFDLGYRPLAIVMFLIAIGAIIYSYLLPKYRAPLEDKDLEPKLDRWIDQVINKLIAQTELPVTGKLSANNANVLKSFPKRERSGNTDVLCKIGQDKRPRITPLGVAVFDLRPDTMVVFEGAVDLKSEAVQYARVHEFRYGDIVALLWTRDASLTARGAAPAATPGRAAMQAVAGKPKADPAAALRHRDLLEIRLVSGRSVSLVFSDTELLPTETAKGGVKPIEDMSRIRRLWDEILKRQATARAR